MSDITHNNFYNPIHSPENNDVSQRGSYFAIHYLPYILLFFGLSAVCILFNPRCCGKNIEGGADENEGSAIVHGQVPLLASQME